MNSLQLKQSLLRLLYIEDPSGLSGTILDGLEADVVNAVNWAFQDMWTAPDAHHFTRKHFSFATVSGTEEYTLDTNLQQVLGPVKVDGATPHLRPVADRGDFDNYNTRFKGATTNTVADARPEAYFLERLWVDGADSVQVKMLLVPNPDDAYTVDFEGSIEAPIWTLVLMDAAGDLQIPHGYVESVLLPIARYYCTRSHYFMADQRPGEMQQILADYTAARKRIGDTDPQIPSIKNDNGA